MNKQDIEIALEDLDTLVEIARNNMTIGGWLGITESALLIKQLLEKQLNNGWIACKDRLPTPKEYQRNDCRFIVTDGNRICEDIYDYMADGYIQPIWIYSKCQPIAWQNMPPRYKEVL